MAKNFQLIALLLTVEIDQWDKVELHSAKKGESSWYILSINRQGDSEIVQTLSFSSFSQEEAEQAAKNLAANQKGFL